MPIDLDGLERLAAQATPGPWKDYCCGEYLVTTFTDFTIGKTFRYEDAEYIAAACNAVPKLMDERRALQERIIELEAELEFYREEKQLEWERDQDER